MVTLQTIAYEETAKQLAGDNEDLLQDIYLSFLESPPASEVSAREQALSIKRQHSAKFFGSLFNERSLEEPLGMNEDGTPFTLLSVLPSKENEAPLPPEAVFRNRRPVKDRYTSASDLPREVKLILRQRFPNLSYVNAVRALLSLPTSTRLPGYWTPEEDELLRATYPFGGSVAVHALLPDRALPAIRTRANKLGVKNESLNVANSTWLSIHRAAKALGKSPQTVRGWIQRGIIKQSKLAHNGKHRFFVVHHDEILDLKRTPPPPKEKEYKRNPFPPVLWARKIHYLVGEDEDGWALVFCKRAIPIHPLGIHPQHWNKKATCKICLTARE